MVEDCAQAIGASSNDLPVGSASDLAALSFYPTKNLGALGDGGAVLVFGGEAAGKCRALRDYGQSSKYVHDYSGLNSRLDEMQAAVLNWVFLPRLSRWTESRREIAQTYLSGIENPLVRPLPVPAGSNSVWHLFPVTVPGNRRDEFRNHLAKRGIESAIHYPRLITAQKALNAREIEVPEGAFRCAGKLAQEEVSLPVNPYLEEREIMRVIEAVNSWGGK